MHGTARASRADITLIQEGKTLSLSVEDDGRGFKTERVSGSTLGLFLMRERAAQFEGECFIDSAEGCGTRIRVTIPL